MAFRDAVLPALDAVRGIPGILGLRPFTVAVLSRTWVGPRPGIGTKSDLTTGVKVDLGVYQVKIKQLSANEILASGGLYRAEDIRVGPITPPYTGSTIDGDAISVFDPPQGVTGFELFFRISGPGYPAAGQWFAKVKQDVVNSALSYFFVLRATGEIPI